VDVLESFTRAFPWNPNEYFWSLLRYRIVLYHVLIQAELLQVDNVDMSYEATAYFIVFTAWMEFPLRA
jgi:hypothetical protein